jgi:alginate O-acetyltransferase complex protein AlgI
VVFDSYSFVLFFGVVWGLDRLPLPWTVRKANLLLASYAFYAAWSPPFVLLLWLSTLIDWVAARGIASSTTAAGRRLFLLTSVVSNLGLLGFFKYGGFLTRAVADALLAVGLRYDPPAIDVVLPVGISFYTFQTLSYSIDVYRGRIPPGRSLLDFALFVSFFPQLVAGPIVRAGDFLPQCTSPRRATPNRIGWGLSLVVLGLFAKVFLADGLMAPVVDIAFQDVDRAGWVTAWTGTLAFAGQVFFDFWGYSTCAIGLAMTLGFSLPDNFLSPYAARGFSDFWRRWHVTLSTWLRDYVYIPLGGNRSGRRRAALNLMITMLVGGLWHGAAWNFVVWGGMHGAFLLAERGLRALVPESPNRRANWAPAGLTFILVCLSWVPFRADSLSDALVLLGTMLAGRGSGWIDPAIGEVRMLSIALSITALLAVQWRLRESTLEEVVDGIPWGVRAAALAALIVAIGTASGEGRAFIYFQF